MVDILHQPSFSILLEDSEVGGYTSVTFPLRSPSQATTPAEILEHFNVTPTHLSLYTPAPRDSQCMPFKDMDSPIVAIKSQRLAKSMMKDKTPKESQVSLQTAATSSDHKPQKATDQISGDFTEQDSGFENTTQTTVYGESLQDTLKAYFDPDWLQNEEPNISPDAALDGSKNRIEEPNISPDADLGSTNMALQEKILALEQRISVLVEALEDHRREIATMKAVSRRLQKQQTKTHIDLQTVSAEFDEAYREMQEQVSGLGWGGNKRSAFINALADDKLPLFCKKDLVTLGDNYCVETNRNTSHRMRVKTAHETVVHEFQHGYITESCFLSFIAMLLLLTNHDEAYIRKHLATAEGRNQIHSILKNSNEVIVPARPKTVTQKAKVADNGMTVKGNRGKWIEDSIEKNLKYESISRREIVWGELDEFGGFTSRQLANDGKFFSSRGGEI